MSCELQKDSRLEDEMLRRDLSNYAPAIQDPLTPTELELRIRIKRNRAYIDAAVYRALQPYGASPVDAQEYVSGHLDKIFFSYIESRFPLETPEVTPFAAYAVAFCIDLVEKQRTQQQAFNNQRYQRTLDPRGMRSMPHPEVP